jgi:hypothetical protein
MRFDTSELKPGDCLCYSPKGFFGWLTAIKTWNSVAHVEVYAARGLSVASRNGIGVNAYPFRHSQLCYVLRPNEDFDFEMAYSWFAHHAVGQKYDWLGLLCFASIRKHGDRNKMFCSEFATKFYAAGGFHPFRAQYPADHISPAQFIQSGDFEVIWKK